MIEFNSFILEMRQFRYMIVFFML